MKKLYQHHIACLVALIITLALTSLVQSGYAQDTTLNLSSAPTVERMKEKKSVNQKSGNRFNKNTFKMNVTSLGLKNYHFTYERMLARKFSAAVSYRTMPSSRLSDLKMVKTGLEVMGEDEAGSTIDDLRNINASNKAITLEFRMYKGSKPGAKGFYTGLFGRYGDFNVGYNYAYEDGSRNSYMIPLQGNATSLSGGVQLGAQFNIFKHITIDWQILGLHFGKLKGDAIGVSNLSTMSVEDQQMLKSEIEDLSPFIKEKKLFPIEAQVNNSGVKAKMNGPFAGLRTGIHIGFAL